MHTAYGEQGCRDAHCCTEPSLKMGLDFEVRLVELIATVARLEQRLESHLEQEEQWREELFRKIDASRSWWQLAISSLIASGVITLMIDVIRHSK